MNTVNQIEIVKYYYCVYLYLQVILNCGLFKEFNESFHFYKYVLPGVNLKAVNLCNYTIIGLFFQIISGQFRDEQTKVSQIKKKSTSFWGNKYWK